MLGITLAVLQYRMVDALNEEALKSYAKCRLLCLSVSIIFSEQECAYLFGQPGGTSAESCGSGLSV